MIRHHRWTVTLCLESPFMSQGLAVSALGVDASAARDGGRRPYLPGSLIAGNLRAALCELAKAGATFVDRADIDRWFGCESRTVDGVRDEPERGRVSVRDLPAREAPVDGGATTRVRIDPDTGSVARGAMQIIELPAPVGRVVAFEGVVGLLADDDEAGRFDTALRAGLNQIDAVGAFKSAGFGRVVCRDVAPREPPAAYDLPSGDTAMRDLLQRHRAGECGLTLSLTFDRPLLVDARRVAGNVFRGAAVVPGAVIKGALARRLDLAGVKADHDDALSAVVIGHAVPMAEGAPPPRPVPLSLAVIGEGDAAHLRDMILDAVGGVSTGTGGAPNGGASGDALPAFSPDWKDPVRRAVERLFGWPEIAHDLRVRTAIDPLTGTAAEDEAGGLLFSHAAVRTGGLVWRGRVHVPDDVAEAEAVALLAALNDDLVGIGKTDAVATGRLEAGPPAVLESGSDDWIVTLASDAVLNDSAALAAGRGLRDDYAGYWREATGLEMIEFFAAQRLAGGYLAYRHQPDGSPYMPYLLTAAGATFLLRGTRTDRLAAALAAGLPLPAAHGGADYLSFPFLPANGYGAMTVVPAADAPRTRRLDGDTA